MKLNKGDKFIATWTPETINGQENMQGQTISRKGQWDDKSKIERHKKTGKLYMTFWDRDKHKKQPNKSICMCLKNGGGEEKSVSYLVGVL